MSLNDFFFTIIVLSLSLVFIVWMGYILVRSIRYQFRGKKFIAKPLRLSGRLDKIDKLIAEQKYREAIKRLKKAVVFSRPKTPQSVEALKEHHQNVLSRCLIVAEELGVRAENIALVEKLFIERSDLHSQMFRTATSFKNLKSKRKQAGKHVPSWSKTEFEQRLADVKKELHKNDSNLKKALESLFESLLKAPPEEIVYH